MGCHRRGTGCSSWASGPTWVKALRLCAKVPPLLLPRPLTTFPGSEAGFPGAGDSFEDWRDIVSAPLPRCASWGNQAASLLFPQDHASNKYPGEPKSNHRAILELFDSRLSSLSGHEARSHMESDLQRYRFAALFASKKGRSPKLADFPMELMPDHGNAMEGK